MRSELSLYFDPSLVQCNVIARPVTPLAADARLAIIDCWLYADVFEGRS